MCVTSDMTSFKSTFTFYSALLSYGPAQIRHRQTGRRGGNEMHD